jgi:acetyl/propionyl-CoA carboxylase alpha subunit
MITKVLIANRGEIAVRVLRTLNELHIDSVAVYSSDESDALHVRQADEAYLLRGSTLADTYLDGRQLIEVARSCGADAVHPGYGFLSENAEFAQRCEAAGLLFIGPKADSIRMMGDKQLAKEFAAKAGIPTLPVFSPEAIPVDAFPLLVKAVGGGGGKGMVKVDTEKSLSPALTSASAQAKRLFGDARIYLEPYLEHPRHIEVQVAGDGKGGVIHLFERECSVQRNFQKIVEETPSPSITAKQRDRLLHDAVAIARKAHYCGLGTVEFLLDEKGQHYFLEMNTRIQVEHPITEAITGMDLVALQVHIANGKALPEQHQIQRQGNALELRVYAEDPANQFLPQQGNIAYFDLPETLARHDVALEKGETLKPNYDALLLKQIIRADDREQLLRKAQMALRCLKIEGVITNTSLLNYILEHEEFEANRIHVNWLDDQLTHFIAKEKQEKEELLPFVALAAASWWYLPGNRAISPWESAGSWRLLPTKNIQVNQHTFTISWQKATGGFRMTVNDKIYNVSAVRQEHTLLEMLVNGKAYRFVFLERKIDYEVIFQNHRFTLKKSGVQALDMKMKRAKVNGHATGQVVAHLFGKVVKIHVQDEAPIKAGMPLMVVEAMKMENTLTAPDDGVVTQIHVKPGQQIADGDLLLTYSNIK